ncbi:hypothetical protein LCGC14_1667020, partial [marine sediment metagenome]
MLGCLVLVLLVACSPTPTPTPMRIIVPDWVEDLKRLDEVQATIQAYIPTPTPTSI